VNRHERRRAMRFTRRSDATRISMAHWTDYIQHLPQVPVDAPELPGRKYHLISHHEPHCRSFVTNRFDDCDCRLAYTKHVEPMRS
jgi:hypothetical protein